MRTREFTINIFSIVFIVVAVTLAMLDMVSWWIILLIVLSRIEINYRIGGNK